MEFPSLLDVLVADHSVELNFFYQDPIICILIYRLLPKHGQIVLDYMILIKGPIPFGDIQAWFPPSPSSKTLLNQSLLLMKKLQILEGKDRSVWMCEEFKNNLILGFAQRMKSIDNFKTSKISHSSTQVISNHWTELAYSIVNITKNKVMIFRDLLLTANLIQRQEEKRTATSSTPSKSNINMNSENDDNNENERGNNLNSGNLKITHRGFQFLVENMFTQIWTILIAYGEIIHDQQKEGVTSYRDYLNLLSRLIDMEPLFKEYNLSSPYLSVLEKLGLVQIIDQQKIRVNHMILFIKYRDVESILDLNDKICKVIVETNYNVFAYSIVPLDLEILKLFIHVKNEFPNMIHGYINKETAQTAYLKGITSEQIIHYLQIHSHPIVQSTESNKKDNSINNLVPPNICDQLRLWEKDLNRIKIMEPESFLYEQFLDQQGFNSTIEEAKRCNALMYSSQLRRICIIRSTHNNHMKKFIQSLYR